MNSSALRAVKRLAWCRWSHRWHRVRRGGWARYYCTACEGRDYGPGDAGRWAHP